MNFISEDKNIRSKIVDDGAMRDEAIAPCCDSIVSGEPRRIDVDGEPKGIDGVLDIDVSQTGMVFLEALNEQIYLNNHLRGRIRVEIDQAAGDIYSNTPPVRWFQKDWPARGGRRISLARRTRSLAYDVISELLDNYRNLGMTSTVYDLYRKFMCIACETERAIDLLSMLDSEEVEQK